MDYNTTREELVFREYGRNVQKLIRHIANIEDKETRNKQAHALVEALAQMDKKQKDNEEFRHKLWDHLFIMSDSQLEVDAPFPKPEKETSTITPPKERMPYPQEKIDYRHYGKNVKFLIEKIKDLDEEEKKKSFTLLAASYMKLAHKRWSRKNVSDDIILDDLNKMAGEKLPTDDIDRIPNLAGKNRR